jgi:hypothetical protein
LEYLSLITPAMKPCFSDYSLVDGKSWKSIFKRIYQSENRKMMIININNIIHLALDALCEYRSTEYVNIIVTGLAKAKMGLQNLLNTYSKDPNIVSQLHVIIMNIDLQLNKYK